MAPVFPMVAVEWEDITNTAPWEDADIILKWEGFEIDPGCISIGFLMHEASDHIILVSQATSDFKKLGMAARIPTGVIRKITLLTGDRNYVSAS